MPEKRKSSRNKIRNEAFTNLNVKLCQLDLNCNLGVAVEEVVNQTPTWEVDDKGQKFPQISRKISRTNSNSLVQPSEQSVMDVGDLMVSGELAEFSNDVPLEKRSPPTDIQRNSSCEEDSWDKLYNETGDLLRPEALEEVTVHGNCF